MGGGVEGRNISVNGWGGIFTSDGNGVYVLSAPGKVGLVVYNGSKSAAVPTSDGDRLLYNEESTEVLFTDYGFGQLKDGYMLVTLESVFKETVNLDVPYYVFLQAYGDTVLYVDRRTTDSFEVQATTNSKDMNAEFAYRIVAKRIGFEEERLELAPWVTEENLYGMPRPIPEPPPLLPDPHEVYP